jgi:hypothetical protein
MCRQPPQCWIHHMLHKFACICILVLQYSYLPNALVYDLHRPVNSRLYSCLSIRPPVRPLTRDDYDDGLGFPNVAHVCKHARRICFCPFGQVVREIGVKRKYNIKWSENVNPLAC